MATSKTDEQVPAMVTVWYDSACPMRTDELMKRFQAQEHGEPTVSGATAFAAIYRVDRRVKVWPVTLEHAANPEGTGSC